MYGLFSCLLLFVMNEEYVGILYLGKLNYISPDISVNYSSESIFPLSSGMLYFIVFITSTSNMEGNLLI